MKQFPGSKKGWNKVDTCAEERNTVEKWFETETEICLKS